MTEYVYKSITGRPVKIDNYIITPNPGLFSKYQNPVLDLYLGISLSRYDDGVLTLTDTPDPTAGPTANLFPKTSYLTKAMLNNAGSGTSFLTSAGPLTCQVQATLETDYVGIQIGVVNADTATASVKMTALAWAAAQADNSSAANYNSATWTDMSQTINGTTSSTMTLAAMPAAISGQGIVSWSDILPITNPARTDSGKTLPGLSIRVEWLSGSNFTYLPPSFTSTASYETDGTANAGRLYRIRGQGVAAGSNATKAALTVTATWSFSPPIFIRYWPKSGTPKTIIVCGDSIASASGGTGSTVNLARYGFAEMLRAQYSTPSKPIDIVNCGLGGATTTNIATMMATVIPAVPNGVAFVPNGTPNGTSGTLSAADVSVWSGFKAKVRLLMDNLRVPYVFWTMLPVGPAAKAWAASDSFRQGINTDDTASGQAIVDLATVLSGTIASGQYPLTNTADNVHPDDTGNALLVAPMAKGLGIS